MNRMFLLVLIRQKALLLKLVLMLVLISLMMYLLVLIQTCSRYPLLLPQANHNVPSGDFRRWQATHLLPLPYGWCPCLIPVLPDEVTALTSPFRSQRNFEFRSYWCTDVVHPKIWMTIQIIQLQNIRIYLLIHHLLLMLSLRSSNKKFY